MADLVLHPRDSVDSTQDEARRLLADGAEAPLAVVTSDQRRGRGRLSRGWAMPPGSGLATTLAHHSTLPPDRRGWYPAVVGLGVLAALEETFPRAATEGEFGLKWPNDVLAADDRKLAGILLESAGTLDARGQGVVLAGVGLNLCGPVQDEEGGTVPGAAWLGGPGGRRAAADGDDTATRLAPRLAVSIQHELDVLDRADGDALVTGHAERYSMACVTLGRVVRVDPLGRGSGGGTPGAAPAKDSWEGRAHDIDAEGRLVVEDGEGRLRPLAVGDVWHLRTAVPAGTDDGHRPWEQEKHS